MPSDPPAADLPDFAADLIKGTFDANLDTSIRQMNAYSDLVAAAGRSVDQFTKDSVSDVDKAAEAADAGDSGEARATRALSTSGVDHNLTRHGRVGSLAEAAAARGVQPRDIVKTLVVRRAEDDFLFVLVPGDREISWPKLRSHLGVSRLSMPDAAVALSVTGYERGTITPFGASTAWPVVADASILEPADRRVSLGAGAHGVAATMSAADLVRSLRADVADVTDPISSPVT